MVAYSAIKKAPEDESIAVAPHEFSRLVSYSVPWQLVMRIST